MQTFMPYSSFAKSILCLDYRRLGKQRVEAKQILDILLNRTNKKGWINHPAVKMWQGYEEALKIYYNFCVLRWKTLGYKNTMKYEKVYTDKLVWPKWLNNKDFVDSHKSNLLRKDPEFYDKYKWNVPANLPYIWPAGLY